MLFLCRRGPRPASGQPKDQRLLASFYIVRLTSRPLTPTSASLRPDLSNTKFSSLALLYRSTFLHRHCMDFQLLLLLKKMELSSFIVTLPHEGCANTIPFSERFIFEIVRILAMGLAPRCLYLYYTTTCIIFRVAANCDLPYRTIIAFPSTDTNS